MKYPKGSPGSPVAAGGGDPSVTFYFWVAPQEKGLTSSCLELPGQNWRERRRGNDLVEKLAMMKAPVIRVGSTTGSHP